MKKVYKKSLTSKLYMILGLCWIWMSMSSCLFDYYAPSSDFSFAPSTIGYCVGATAAPVVYTYNTCDPGGGILSTGSALNVQWYYNTTGSTSIPGSTPLGSPIATTAPVGGTGNVSFTPLTTTAGTFYYFAYITWSDPSCLTELTTGTMMVTVSPPTSTFTGPSSSCAGITTTLTPTGPPGVWSSSTPAVGTVSGGVVTGISAGTTTISYTTAGCSALMVFTVLTTPANITPAAATVFCQGTTVTLATSPAGGTWSSSAPLFASVNTSGVVTGVAGGTATISYQLSSGCYRTKAVTVNALAGPILGSGVSCSGYANTLTTTGTGGTWSSSNTGVATIGLLTGIVTGSSTGTTRISYIGCGTTTRVISVNVTPPPIAGPSIVCEGGATIVVSNPALGGTWSSATPAIATALTASTSPDIGIITGVTAGTTDITYTSSLSCFAIKTITVNPLPAPLVGIVPICVGNSMTLTNAAGGGSWSSSVSGVATADPFTGLITGVAGGTATISYVNGCGTGTAVITVDALPVPLTGRDSVCIGAYTTLADVVIGGTWSSSNPAVASVLIGSGHITGNAVGTTTISYIMPGGCYTTAEVTSFLLPSSISGITALCPGSTTVLANSISGGTWSSNNPVAASIGSASGVVTALSSDTVGMVYTTPYGCIAYGLMTVNPVPQPIIGDLVFCANLGDTLADITPGGLWSSLSPSVASIDPVTGVVTPVAGGTANIKYTLPTGCYTTKLFTIDPMPTPTVTFNAAINTFYADPGYYTYQWYNSVQGLIPGATTWRTAGLVNGDYWVVVTDEKGCIGNAVHVHYDLSMGVKSTVDISQIRIYPNPSAEMIYIESPVAVRAVISGVDGKKEIDQDNARHIDISKLASGLYFVTIFDESGAQLTVQKLTKE